MASSLSARQWSALRELAEGEPSTYPRLAAVAGINTSTVQVQAAQEGWSKLDFRKAAVLQAFGAARQAADAPDGASGDAIAAGTAAPTAPFDEEDGAGENSGGPLGRLSRLLSRQAGLILTSAEAQNGVLNKAQLDALSSLIKLAEKFETLARERAKEEQTRSDDEVAAVLERIDDRIIELAAGYAETLGARKSDGG